MRVTRCLVEAVLFLLLLCSNDIANALDASQLSTLHSWSIVPTSLTADSLRHGQPGSNSSWLAITIYNETLSAMNLAPFSGAKIRDVIGFTAVGSRSDEVEPYGFDSYVSQLCPQNVDAGSAEQCATLVLSNTSAIILLQFRQVSTFDIRFDQTVFVTFSPSVFYSTAPVEAHSLQIPFGIIASLPSPQLLGSYAIGVPLLCATLLSQLTSPNQFDLIPFLLSTHGTCSTSTQRSWSFFSSYASFWAGGDTMLNRCVRMLGIVAFMYVSVTVSLVLLRRVKCCSRLSLLDDSQLAFLGHTASLVSVQVTLLFAAMAAFAAGSLLSSPDREAQGVGMLVAVVVTIAFAIVVLRVWIDEEWRYIYILDRDAGGGPSNPIFSFLRSLSTVSGYWFSSRYIVPKPMIGKKLVNAAACGEKSSSSSSNNSSDDKSLVALDKWILCKEFEGFHGLQSGASVGVNKRNVVVHYVVMLLPLLAAGLSPRSPDACFWQFVLVAALHGVAAGFLLKFVQARCKPWFVLTVLIRVVNVAVFALLALFPSNDGAARGGFSVLEVAILVLAAVRLVISIAIWRADIMRPLAEERSKSLFLSEEQEGAAPASPTGKDDAREMERPLLQLPSAEAQLPAFTSPAADNAAAAGGATLSGVSNAPQPSATTLEMSHMSASAQEEEPPLGNADLPEPRFIRDAWPTKPKPKQSDYIEMRRPLWFPEERPHVRTHNIPQLTIALSSYSVRKVGQGTR